MKPTANEPSSQQPMPTSQAERAATPAAPSASAPEAQPGPPRQLPIAAVALAYNHLRYAISRGVFNDRPIDDLKAIVDNTVLLRDCIPQDILRRLPTDGG